MLEADSVTKVTRRARAEAPHRGPLVYSGSSRLGQLVIARPLKMGQN